MCGDFVEALEALKARVERACGPMAWMELRVDFADLRTRALSIKAQVPAACVCEAVKEPLTLEEVRRERRAGTPALPEEPQHVPMFPRHCEGGDTRF